jgi:hypothetical protein
MGRCATLSFDTSEHSLINWLARSGKRDLTAESFRESPPVSRTSRRERRQSLPARRSHHTRESRRGVEEVSVKVCGHVALFIRGCGGGAGRISRRITRPTDRKRGATDRLDCSHLVGSQFRDRTGRAVVRVGVITEKYARARPPLA